MEKCSDLYFLELSFLHGELVLTTPSCLVLFFFFFFNLISDQCNDLNSQVLP